jgi:16S rRNA (guanine527-N7)-methyltransferase
MPAPNQENPLADQELLAALAEARRLGFLGPAPFEDHVRNGLDFVGALSTPELSGDLTVAPLVLVDLGSGGGVPALVMARALPAVRMHLIDRGERRCAFLGEVVEFLGLSDRVDVYLGDAEQLAWHDDLTGVADAVTARSFGPPSVTAEAGCRFIRPNGMLLVSEPPHGDGSRWDATGLAKVGLTQGPPYLGVKTTVARLGRSGEIGTRYPRRAAASRKRPLF